MRQLPFIALLLPVLIACGGTNTAPTATTTASATAANASASTTVDGVTLHASTLPIADLNAAIAERYGIDRGREGVLLLVTVRDAAGEGIDPGDLQLRATAGTLTESPRPLSLRAIVTNGMTDYIGVLHTGAPATVQFRLTGIRGGSRAEVATGTELFPR